MRADRLLSILLHLQTRGRTTTARLAAEFEVSQRTVLRDLYALRVAGFPVHTERGRHGGCHLHEEYRSTLTHLTPQEVAAFFLSSIHKPLEDLGLSDPLRSARLKLSAALSDPRHAAAQRLAERIVIDSLPWRKRPRALGSLALLYEATLGDRWVRATFARQFGSTTRDIAPYGLASKAGEWYAVWAGEDDHLRVDAVPVIRRAVALATPFTRPETFDLQEFWDEWKAHEEQRQPSFAVRLRVRKDAIAYVRDALEDRRGPFPQPAAAPGEWIEMSAGFAGIEDARRRLLALGGAVEVAHPPALRASVEDFANQICAVYSSSAARLCPRRG